MTMQHPQTCLSAELLRQLSHDELSPAELKDVEDHVSDCERCRQLLEVPQSDPQWQDEIVPILRTPLESPHDAGDHDERGCEGESLESILRLLGPTDDPHMLGRIGSYEVVGVIGRGGMGVVFKAYEGALNRFVAIKMLLPHLAASGAARKRFAREGQAAAAVIDDNVMPIYSVAEWQGVPYLVTQYSRGATLEKRIRDQGPLELKEILRIGMQTARGLAAAHAQGLVHRDVKPSNILLDGTVERALLTDFGLARAVDDASITRTGIIAGTPQYMSPEQARGGSVDARSDLFGLGCVLYAMCTGRPPFRAENSYAILRMITDDEPRSIREINPDIPEWLCLLISRLMSKSPDARFGNALEVAALLEQCLAHVQQPTSVPLPAFLVTQAAGRRSIFNSTRKGMIAMIGTLGMTLLGMVLLQATEAPDISGQWSSVEWGTVVLEAKGPGEYEGTFTGSGKDKPAPSNDPLRGLGAGSGLPGAPGAGSVPAGGYPGGAVLPGIPGDPGAGSVPPGGPGDVPNGLGVRSKSGRNGPAPMAFDFPGNFGSLRGFSFYLGIDDSEAGRSRDGIHNKTKSGTLHLKWSRLERRFNGTWGWGADRRGTMSLRLVDKEIRGGWTTDEEVQLESGTPLIGDLLWKRRVVTVPDGGTVLHGGLGGPETANAATNTPPKIIPGEILVEIYAGRGIWKSLESRNRVGKLLLSLKAVKGVTVDTHEDGEGDAFTKAAVHMPTHVGETDVESKTQEESLRTIKIAIGEALRAHKVPNIRWLVYPGIAPDEDKRGLPSPHAPRFETPLDRQNARSVVEAFVAAALAGDRETVITLAKLNRRDLKRPTERIENNIPYLPDRKHLSMTSVQVNDAENPSEAIAVSEQFKWEHPRSARKTDVVAWFTLSMSEAGWIVTNISFEWIESIDGMLKKFLEANPKSISVPPLTKRPASNPFHDLQGVWEYISVEADGVVTEYKTPVSSEVLSITDNLWKMNSLMGSVNRVEIDGRNLTFHGKTSTGSASGVGGDVPSIAYGIYALDDDSLGFCMTPFVPSSQVGPGADAFGGPVIKHPQNFETKGTQNLAYRLRRSAAKVSAIEQPLDRQNALPVVEAFVAAAIAGDEMTINTLAPISRSQAGVELYVGELKFLKLAKLRIESVYVNDLAKPTKALATSVEVRLEGKTPRLHEARVGFLVVTLGHARQRTVTIASEIAASALKVQIPPTVAFATTDWI
jgi:hypothetical protein